MPDDVEALRAMVVAQAAELAAKDGLIGTLRLQLAQLHRQQFGRSSERLNRDIDQLELTLEDLDAEQAVTTPASDGHKGQDAPASAKPVRRPLPGHLPCGDVEHKDGSEPPADFATSISVGSGPTSLEPGSGA